ncbi:hypothetical protein HanXRQr2_Chr03g0135891 [Helianthus annuus]|uniref:Uncharacterized protein n=1 Tax=Helianthus annuus TaxID=4232 RepID=A0A9K3JJS2_HELAN|nr:hypothetical protein HanXRQr2_Chr03g0135891 [Helianthus annuus]
MPVIEQQRFNIDVFIVLNCQIWLVCSCIRLVDDHNVYMITCSFVYDDEGIQVLENNNVRGRCRFRHV